MFLFKFRSSFLALLFSAFIGAICAPRAWADESHERFAAIVIDAETGETLYARHADARRYPASLTKVMTLFLAFDALDAGKLKLDGPVVISPRAAARPPSRLGLPVGDRLTVRQAMDVMVVKSANDIATALGETLGGTEAGFARAMNAKAKTLGMTATHFTNASGLPDLRHYSTARDLALMGRAFLRDHPDDYAIFDQTQTIFRGRTIRGHNALLMRTGIDGFKTGYIDASGFNLLTSGVRDGHRVIAVVLGGRTARTRDAFMIRLMRASFASLSIRDAGTRLTVASLLELDDRDWFPTQASTPPITLALASPQDLARPPQGQGDATGSQPIDTAWWIQVGAYSSKAQGEARLAEVRARHPNRFGARSTAVYPVGALFAARFAAKSRAGAETACAALTAEGEACMTLEE
jgi:D-alanyl-D-alanine carboxypeptidase (penicillin-binding protein 5/6)